MGQRWLHARQQERIFGLLVRSKKITPDAQGIAQVEAQIRSVLNEAATNRLISPEYSVSSPNPTTISTNDKANRILGDFRWTAVLLGAVHKVVVYGSLEY